MLTELARTVEAASPPEGAPPAGPGRLPELAGWLAATQGQWPPAAPERVRLLLVAPVVPPAVAELADLVGAGVRLLSAPDDGGAEAGLYAGAAAADEEADAGADLLVVAGAGAGAVAAAVIAVVADLEPTSVLPPYADDTGWAQDVVTVRTLLRRCRPYVYDPDGLLAEVGDRTLAALAGALVRAAARRTPVVLDGPAAHAVAVLGGQAEPTAADWWLTGSADPSTALMREALARLGRAPVLDLGAPPDVAAGLLAVPVLRAAARLAAVSSS